MRVGLFVDAYTPDINGVVTAIETLSKTLIEHGDEVYVITTNPFGKETYLENNILRIPGLTLKRIYGYRIAWIYNHKAVSIIKKLHLDIIHIHTELSIGIFGRILARKLDIPLVYTYHTMYIEYTYYVTKGVLDPVAKSIVKRLSRSLAMNCTEFITTSLKTKNALRSYNVNRYINVIPNGIDIEAFSRDKYDEKEFCKYRKEHGYENKFLILVLGRIAKEKSIDVCIKEYAEFLRTKPKRDTLMLIVGEGPAKEELEQLAMKENILSHVVFVGKVPLEQVSFYYNLCDLYISASLSETQGLTFIEAMASRLPVLCQYDDNLNDVVLDGKTGYFFYSEKECHEKLAYVLSLSDEERKKITENAYKLVQKFSIDIFYSSMKEVYNRAIRKRW